jgi:diamine N-acetyltransferase
MVGFVMIGYIHPDDEEDEYYCDEPFYYLWRLFVDIEHQRKGYGKEMLRLAMEKIKTQYLGEANLCFASYAPENTASRRTFAAYGFEEDGLIIGGETVCKIVIVNALEESE